MNSFINNLGIPQNTSNIEDGREGVFPLFVCQESINRKSSNKPPGGLIIFYTFGWGLI